MADDDVMAGRVSFLSVTEADAKAAASWLDDDPEGQEEFGGFYGIHPKWWSLVSADNSRYGWTLWRGAEPVGFVDAEVDFEGTAEVVVYIRPSHRGLGLGSAALRALGPVCRRVGAVRLRGAVRPDNVASLAAAVKASAEVTGTDEYGYLVLIGPRLDGGENSDR